jgi:hypothetical protein
MKNTFLRPLVLAAFLTLFMAFAAGQTIDMNFQGLLTDGQGKEIVNEPFDFVVKLMTADAAKAELCKQVYAIQTDEGGWFSFSIPEISSYLMVEDHMRDNLVIRMEFLPNATTRWLKSGQDFMVSYTLSPVMKEETIYLKMTRMEGSELTTHLEENLYVFKDEYPFAYLTGGFLLTDAPPLDEASPQDLRTWILPDPAESGEATRGVKAGFPKGGYKKR